MNIKEKLLRLFGFEILNKSEEQPEKYNRKTLWSTHLGNKVSVEGMADEHLANTIQYLTYYHGHNDDLLEILKKEAKIRKLSEEFLGKAQYPYKDGLGNYIVWDFVNDRPKVVGSYLRGGK